MAISSRGNALLFRLRARLAAQRYNHTVADSGLGAQFRADVGPGSVLVQGRISRRKLDSRAFGITRSMISSPSWTVLKVLRGAGFEAYLVGGCVRDLILNRVPKDFDVITTAKLKQIKKEFRRCTIVGQRFPICMVHVKGSVVEVSSFETVAKHGEEKEIVLPSDIPHGCDRKDFVLWKNCMQRDFTINSLFFDPFINSIYDYVNGIVDVKCLKLRTLIPAEASFQEDCARILRGVRIAARLGLSFSEDTENAIHKLSLSIATLTKSRLLLELNYMLSYGAAEPSFHLLQRFNLLEILLPFHAAYLAEQAREQSSQNPAMLMKLFFNLDKLVTCDQPAESTLWVALLAFHLALVINSQDALVVWTFASVLYHQSWKLGVKFARKHAQTEANFIPEISEAHESISDAELAERATHLAAAAQYSINALTDRDSLLQLMSRFPDLTCSGLSVEECLDLSTCFLDVLSAPTQMVFVPSRIGRNAAKIFEVPSLQHDLQSYEERRATINYDQLRKGNTDMVRIVLGKIIMDTLSNGVVHYEEGDPEHVADVPEEICHGTIDILGKDTKSSLSPSNAELQQKRANKQKSLEEAGPSENRRVKQKADCSSETKKIAEQKHEMIENNEYPELDQAVKQHEEDKLSGEKKNRVILSRLFRQ